MTGLYFEDFHEGQTFEHAVSRTVTEMDNVLFSSLTLNPQPLHLDEEFAKTTVHGRRLAGITSAAACSAPPSGHGRCSESMTARSVSLGLSTRS